MGKKTCPLRVGAHKVLDSLNRHSLGNTQVYRMVARELDRDCLQGESRLNLALPKVQPLMVELSSTRAHSKRRMAAVTAILSARIRVR
jgi:hypothetical protein